VDALRVHNEAVGDVVEREEDRVGEEELFGYCPGLMGCDDKKGGRENAARLVSYHLRDISAADRAVV
jgi:hypothetical protein